jgi:hypothetical protein
VADQETKIDGHTYSVGRISTFDQLHVASLWREALMGLALAKKNRPPTMTDEAFAETKLIVLTGSLGRVDWRAREDVARLLMSVVKRKGAGGKTGTGWFSVMTPEGVPAYADIQLPQLVQIQYAVLDKNGLLDFFSVGPSASGGPTETEEGGRDSQETERTS